MFVADPSRPPYSGREALTRSPLHVDLGKSSGGGVRRRWVQVVVGIESVTLWIT